MMKRLLALTVLLMSFSLTACLQTKEAPRFDPIRFTDKAPINLDVAQIVIEEIYVPPLAAPNVEHRFPVVPAEIMRAWAVDRLRATGNQGKAVFSIRNASVIETKLKVKKGLIGLFQKDQESRYDAVISARLAILKGVSAGQAEAKTAYSRTAPEGLTLNEKDILYHEIAVGLAQQFDETMETQVKRYLKDFIQP